MVLKFIFRVLMFLSIPVVLVGGWTVFIVTLDYRSYRSSLSVPKGRDIVVCGDSQTENCLDPKYFPRIHNFSVSATDPGQNLLRLRDVLSANTNGLRYAILDVTTPHVGYDESIPLSDLGPTRTHALVNLYHYSHSKRPIGSFAKIFRDLVLVEKFRKFRKDVRKGHPYRSSLIGEFKTKSTRGFIDHPEKTMRSVDRRTAGFNEKPCFSTSCTLANVLRDQAEAMKNAGIEPVFMITPVSGTYLEKLDAARVDAFTNGIAAIAGEYNAPFFNYFSRRFPVDCWRDGNHLNTKGAEVFTTLFRKDFLALEKTRTGRR